MFKVHDIMYLANGMPVLVCDLFQDSDIKKRLSTNIGEFSDDEFVIGQVHYCFGAPKSRTIMLRLRIDCSNIKSVDFV